MTAKYLVDTDWVIEYLHGNEPVVSTLKKLRRLAISVVTLAELYEGVYYSTDPETSERTLNDFIKDVALIGIDEETAKLFGRERGRLRKAKKQVGDFDLLIGMTARQHDLTLLTNNRRHFTLIEGVRIESA